MKRLVILVIALMALIVLRDPGRSVDAQTQPQHPPQAQKHFKDKNGKDIVGWDINDIQGQPGWTKKVLHHQLTRTDHTGTVVVSDADGPPPAVHPSTDELSYDSVDQMPPAYTDLWAEGEVDIWYYYGVPECDYANGYAETNWPAYIVVTVSFESFYPAYVDIGGANSNAANAYQWIQAFSSPCFPASALPTGTTVYSYTAANAYFYGSNASPPYLFASSVGVRAQPPCQGAVVVAC